MPPVNTRCVIPCDLVPWLGVLHTSKIREGHHWSFSRAALSRFSTDLRAIQFVLNPHQVFLDFPSDFNLCHRPANLVISHRQVQARHITINLD